MNYRSCQSILGWTTPRKPLPQFTSRLLGRKREWMSSPTTPEDLLDLKLLPAWVNEPARPNDYANYEGEDPGSDERGGRRPRAHSRDRDRRGPQPRESRGPQSREQRSRGPRPDRRGPPRPEKN